MPNHAASRFLLVLLVILAGALGYARVASSQRAPETVAPARAAAAPTAHAYNTLARRGFKPYLHYRVTGDGPLTVNLTVRVKGRLALSARLANVTPSPVGRETWKPKPISARFPAGVYAFCVVVTDAAGASARSCAPVRVV